LRPWPVTECVEEGPLAAKATSTTEGRIILRTGMLRIHRVWE